MAPLKQPATVHDVAAPYSGRGWMSEEGAGRVLYLSKDNPTEGDRVAEEVMKRFDPNIEIQYVAACVEMSTPRLFARYSFFRSLESIKSFIEQEGIRKRLRRRI